MENIYSFNKKTLYSVLTVAAWVLMFCTYVGCRKSPTDGVGLVVNSNIIKYSANIQIRDVMDSTKIPTNVTLNISGLNADAIYEISGKKDFTIHNGNIDIGVNPALVPRTGAPVSFNLEISADGYMPVSQEVQIAAGQTSQALRIVMLNLNNLPAGVTMVQQDVDASTGSLLSDQAIKISDGQAPYTASLEHNVFGGTPVTVYSDNALTTVVLPAGTKFNYARFIKTGTATGVGTFKVPAPKDTTVYTTTITSNSTTTYTQVPNTQPITGTGLSQYTLKPVTVTTYDTTITSRTYRPLRDTVESYQYDLGYTEWVPYLGKVHVVCQYEPPSHLSTSSSIYPYNLFKPQTLKMLDGTSVSEDELLYANGLKAVVKGLYFIGTVKGVSMMITPANDINGDATRATTWRVSSVVDPNTINPYTHAKVKIGDKMDIAVDYKKRKTVQAIVQGTHGQLRVETRSGNAGFYHRAKNIQVYAFNVNNVPQADIPDPYNIISSGTISCGQGSFNYFYMDPTNTPDYYSFYGKVISDLPLSNPVLTYYTGYFALVKKYTVNNFGTANLFSGITGLYPATTIDVSLTCTGDPSKPITVKPSYSDFLSFTDPNGNSFPFYNYFRCTLTNGVFVTRGLAPGGSISDDTWVGYTHISFALNTKPGINPVDLTFGYKDNKICNTF